MIPGLPWWAWVLVALAVWVPVAIVAGIRIGRRLERLDQERDTPPDASS